MQMLQHFALMFNEILENNNLKAKTVNREKARLFEVLQSSRPFVKNYVIMVC